jgi:UDP-glucose 4-epimerase
MMTGRRILITGGAGFIGSHLAERLAENNFVRIVDNFSTGSWENLASLRGSETVEIIEDDIRQAPAAHDWCAGIEVVFHLAVSCLRTSLGNPRASHNVNAGGTLNLCAAALERRVERFVYVSSSEVYGSAQSVPMTELHPLEPTTVYGAAKLAGEYYAKAFHRTYGLRAIIVRPFNTYGPREPWKGTRAEVIPRFILRMQARQAPVIFGDGTQTRDFTFVDDTVEGILRAAECEVLIGDAVNIATGRETSIRLVAEWIGKELGWDEPPLHAAPRPGDVTRHWADVSKARCLLGYVPRVDFRTGLRRTIDWFRSVDTGERRPYVDPRGRRELSGVD